jgi:gamma-glutamyltranspeptidase/glutathione hydrolase
VVAAGHAVTAEAGAQALRDGGNAVDAALAAMLASFTAEPVLTGMGAGGYMLVAPPGERPVLLDFFVEAPGRGAPPGHREELVPVVVSFGDVDQVFNIGPASVGTYGVPAGICEASRRFGRLELADLCARGAAIAREGVVLNRQQAYVSTILAEILTSTPEGAALHAPGGKRLGEGDVFRNPDLGDMIERLGREGAEPFYTGEIGTAISEWVSERGGSLTREDLAAYEVIEREPVVAHYRGREVLTNPPPSAGGILIVYALDLLEREPEPPDPERVVEAMEAAQRERTAEFLEGLDEPGFQERFLSSRLGNTTHISVLDADGWACSVTCSNGSCSGVVVPGTGIDMNNMLGEQDLNPLGFHQHPPGRRLPSMMAPTIVRRDGEVELVLGSGGSNRIRSAILQTVVNLVAREMAVHDAVLAPRLHLEDDIVYAEPGIDTSSLEAAGRPISRFRARNLFFGGVHAVGRAAGTDELIGAGDIRRGGAAVAV